MSGSILDFRISEIYHGLCKKYNVDKISFGQYLLFHELEHYTYYILRICKNNEKMIFDVFSLMVKPFTDLLYYTKQPLDIKNFYMDTQIFALYTNILNILYNLRFSTIHIFSIFYNYYDNRILIVEMFRDFMSSIGYNHVTLTLSRINSSMGEIKCETNIYKQLIFYENQLRLNKPWLPQDLQIIICQYLKEY